MKSGLILGVVTLSLVGSTAGLSAPDTSALLIDAVIRPAETVPLGIPVEGRLGSIVVDIGDEVTAGQFLASLESEVEELDLALARQRTLQSANVESAKVRIERAREQLEAQQALGGIVSEQDLRALRAEQRLAEIELIHAEERRDLAQLEMERAEARLAMRKIVAPFDGVVTERQLSPGQLVDSGNPVLTLVQIDPLKVEVYVPVERLGTIELGDEVWVRPSVNVTDPVRATVERIDPIVHAGSLTFGVELAIPNPDGAIPAGVMCTVNFSENR